MVLCEPQWKDIELVIAGEHRIKGGQVAQRLFHHLRSGIDEDAMHSGYDVAQLLLTASCQQQPQGVFPLGLLIERADDFAQVIDMVVGSFRARAGFERGQCHARSSRASVHRL